MTGPTRNAAVVAWGGMLVAPLVVAAVTVGAAAPPPEMRSPELTGLFRWLAAAVVGLGIALSRVLPARIRPRPDGGRDAAALARLAVAWALLEGAALFTLVANLVTGDPVLFLLTAAAMAALASLFPSPRRWAEHAGQPLPGGGPNRLVRW